MNVDYIWNAIKSRVAGVAFPEWQSWTPTLTGFSADPTNCVYRYRLQGKTCFFSIRQATDGTSNGATFTISLPFTAATITNHLWLYACSVVDHSTPVTTFGRAVINSGATVLTLGINASVSGGFTDHDGKRVAAVDGWYEVA